jgi:hypothetical protein
MARHRKLTQKFAGFPIFKVGTSGDTFPVTSPFTTGFTGYGDGLSLDLQFATDKTLTARKGPTPVFTRASTATFVGSDGLIQSAAINAPRFDHDPVTLASRGLLIEESRTNSITGSNAFNTWALANCTVAASSVVTPEGTANAWKVAEDILLAGHTVTRVFSAVSGTTYTASVWIKSAENGFAFVGMTSSAGAFVAAFISVNLSTGAVTTAVGTPVGATSVSYPNGWFRVSFSLTAIATFNSLIDIRLSRDGNWANRSYLGNGVNGMYCYGAQVEAGTFATSYIPTVASTVVRSADLCSITGADFTSFYNQSEGSLACNYSITSGFTGNRYAASIEDAVGGSLNGFVLRNTNSATSFIAGAGYSSIIGAVTTTVSKHILAYSGLSEFAYVKDSVVGTTTGSGTRDPSLPIRMSIGTIEGQNGFTLCGHISAIRYFRKRLPNVKLQAITA